MSGFLIWRPGRRPRLGVSASRAVGCLFVVGIVAFVVWAVVSFALGGPCPAEFTSGAAILSP